jgi:hypothetical protein
MLVIMSYSGIFDSYISLYFLIEGSIQAAWLKSGNESVKQFKIGYIKLLQHHFFAERVFSSSELALEYYYYIQGSVENTFWREY